MMMSDTKTKEDFQERLESIGEGGSLFAALIEYSPQSILITDIGGHILYVNHAWEKMFGYTLKEVKGQTPNFLQSGKTPKILFTKMWKSLQAGKVYKSSEMINKRKNGTLVYLQTTTYPFVRADGEQYYVQILEDITKKKNLEGFQKSFIQVAAHDIRTPLASLQLICEMTLLDSPHRRSLTKSHKEVQEQIRQLDKLTRTLLDVSIFETGKIKPHSERVELGHLIHTAIARTSAKVAFKAPGKVFVKVDPVRITQVISNLIDNAIKYSPKKSPISVELNVAGKTARVSVKDVGQGISAADQKKIFSPFFRSADVRLSTEGTGLGLYIVRQIIKAHKGKIGVQSKKGQGSTFMFTLPVCQ